MTARRIQRLTIEFVDRDGYDSESSWLRLCEEAATEALTELGFVLHVETVVAYDPEWKRAPLL